jgi:hypothetical protein
MEQGFIEKIQRMVNEQGKEILINGNAKLFLNDYLQSEYRKEANILRQILDMGCGRFINEADNVLERKRQLALRLEDENSIIQKATAPMLDLIGFILKGDTSTTVKTLDESKADELAAREVPEAKEKIVEKKKIDFNYTYKKFTGGRYDAYAKVIGYIEPSTSHYEFVDAIVGGAIPRVYIPCCDEGFKEAMEKQGISGLRFVLTDGQYHPVGSSKDAFKQAAIFAFQEAYPKLLK